MINYNDGFISKVENILVAGKNNQVGDMICSLPLYVALKKKFTDAKITLVTAQTNYPVPIRDINPYIDKILVYEKSTVKKQFDFYRALRKEKYQLGIVTSTFAYSTTSHIINYLSGAKIRVGVKSIDGRINKASKFLNVKKDFYWDREKKHQKERNLDVIRQIGCDLTKNELDNTGLSISRENEAFASKFIETNFPDTSRTIIGFHPGAGKEANIWKTGNFIDLITSLYEKYRNYVLITGGWADKEILTEITSKINERNISFAVAYNFEITALAALLNRINLYITNDTGTMHIAGSTTCAMISLFGPTKAYEWAPCANNKLFIQSESGNINDINTADVLTRCDNLIVRNII